MGNIVVRIQANDPIFGIFPLPPMIVRNNAPKTLGQIKEQLYDFAASNCSPIAPYELSQIMTEDGTLLNNDELILINGIYIAVFKRGVRNNLLFAFILNL